MYRSFSYIFHDAGVSLSFLYLNLLYSHCTKFTFQTSYLHCTHIIQQACHMKQLEDVSSCVCVCVFVFVFVCVCV